MNQFSVLGKFLVITGIVLAGLGVLLLILPKIPFLGRLPGDIVIRRENFTFYFPLGTSILLSIVLSIIFYLLRK
ncbi:MAG: DUF2905 domain-containing protein [Deltaproteobacteria bacterium]